MGPGDVHTGLKGDGLAPGNSDLSQHTGRMNYFLVCSTGDLVLEASNRGGGLVSLELLCLWRIVLSAEDHLALGLGHAPYRALIQVRSL